MKKTFALLVCFLLIATITLFSQNGLLAAPSETSQTAPEKSPLYIAVTDPLSLQLACECTEGFANRDYEKLADYLQEKLGREVKCISANSIGDARIEVRGPVHLVIGKDSMIRYEAGQWVPPIKLRPLAALTDKDGKTTFTGLFIVRADDPAKTLDDLTGYQIFFGSESAVEKSEAAIEALRKAKAEIKIPDWPIRAPNCAKSAEVLLEVGKKKPTVAVISSYSLRPLEAGKTIKPGSLRVIGHTDPVPFIRVFATDALDKPTLQKVEQALLSVADAPKLLKAIQSKKGFIRIRD